MKTNLPLLLAASSLILAGCSTTPRTWEYKTVSSVTEKSTLCQQGWEYAALIHGGGGTNAFLMKRKVDIQTAAPAVAARPPFHPMLITTFGTHPDGSWKIRVAEDSIDLGDIGFTPDSHGWRAQAGWFVFIESDYPALGLYLARAEVSRVWAYDGDRRLHLHTATSNGSNSLAGAIYYGVFRGTNFDSNFPCAVPSEVISHLPEQRQKQIQTHG
ncbi:MAG: hypothetical protein NT154_18395 [Verrucomicrobia bacterium]|nr:hypothetical protein [Verrucomicrobiota bacterium]